MILHRAPWNTQTLITLQLFAVALLIFGTADSALGYEPGAQLQLNPTWRMTQSYDDNFLRRAQDEEDSWLTVIEPEFALLLERAQSRLAMNYTLAAGLYSASDSDKFVDNKLELDGLLQLDYRHGVHLRGNFLDGHEARGTGILQGERVDLADSPIEFVDRNLETEYRFGGEMARGQLAAAVLYKSRHFSNHDEFTANLDWQANGGAGKAYLRVGSRTKLLLESSYLNTEYAHYFASGGSLAAPDNETFRVLTGVLMDAPGALEGAVKIGAFRKRFEDNRRGETSGASWSASVLWKIRSYSSLSLFAEQSAREPYDVAEDFIDADIARLRWRHKINSRWMLDSQLTYEHADFKGSSAARLDESLAAELGVEFKPSDRLLFSAVLENTDRQSNVAQYDYQRNVIRFGVEMRL